MEPPVRPPKYRFYLRNDHTALGRVARTLSGHRPVPAFPRVVQIQTRTGCNADCCFCPYGETADVVPKGRMSAELFGRILDECRQYNVSRISPYLMNEPFVDAELLDRVAEIRRRAPSAKVCITTNGEPMLPRVVDRMLNQGGVSRLYVSVQGIDEKAYDRTMRGPQLARVIENVQYLASQLRARRLRRPRLTVTMVETSQIDTAAALAFWAQHGIEAKSTRLENRGGNIDVAAGDVNNGSRPMQATSMQSYTNCSRLMRQAYVLHDGRVTLCCTDYHQTTILGDLNRQSLFDIWNDERAVKLRREFILGDLSDNPLCAGCTIAERHVL